MKIALGTTSELKIRALESALQKVDLHSDIIPIKTDSGVSDQPFGYEEMIEGAKNRVSGIKTDLDADLYVSIESGLVLINNMYFDIACVYCKSREGQESLSFSSGYFVPDWMIDEIKEKNTELGFIIKKLSGDNEKDPINFFSDKIIKREELISQAITIALVKIIDKDKYTKQ